MAKIIATDLDDILADGNSFINFHNETFNTNLTKSDFTHYHLRDIIGISRDEEFKRIIKYFNSPHFQNQLPLSGAVEAIAYLSQNNKIIAITARPRFTREKTIRWLEKYFPEIQEVYFTADARKSKSDICKETGAETIIEDRLDYALDCSLNGINVFLLDYPWNEARNLPINVRRVKSWEEILDNLK